MSAKPTAREYQGPADLRALQGLVQSLWDLGSRFHVGDIAWQRSLARESDWPTMLWEHHDKVVGWGWTHLPGHLYLAVAPETGGLTADILDWFEEVSRSDELSVDVLDLETHLVSALMERGYHRADDAPFDLYTRLDLSRLPPKPILPMGFRAMSMRECGDVKRRVQSHRAAWHPSSMTEEQYRRVMASWPYRPELDWVIEVSDGRLVANCTIWLDETNKVGLLEPVGVDPGFRRLGLARAVCLHALHALRDLGGALAVTYPRGDDAYPFAKPLYLGMGFEPYARTISFVRRRNSSKKR